VNATTARAFFRPAGVNDPGIAILLDATIARGVLVPAVMRLIGERIWLSPPPLRRLYRHVGIHELPDTTTTPDRRVEPVTSDS
jgi:RND superfamily putative drug exporter